MTRGRGSGLGLVAVIVGLLLLVVLPVSAITWGQPGVDHTNVGAMVVDWPDYGPYQWCSGTLIHPQVFLTAGHCTDGLEEYGIGQVWVNLDVYAANPGTLLPVAEVITHPEYAWGVANPHDVGLLVLAEPVHEIEPALLPAEGLLGEVQSSGRLQTWPDGARLTVVGYGDIPETLDFIESVTAGLP